MLCANPDVSVILPDGSHGSMPGVIGEAYERLGGNVDYFGKPHAPAFDAAIELLGPDVDVSRVLHVGDSLLHDVAGANAVGIHSLFVAGGIHHKECGVVSSGGSKMTRDAELKPTVLQRVFRERGIAPTLSTPAFVW